MSLQHDPFGAHHHHASYRLCSSAPANSIPGSSPIIPTYGLSHLGNIDPYPSTATMTEQLVQPTTVYSNYRPTVQRGWIPPEQQQLPQPNFQQLGQGPLYHQHHHFQHFEQHNHQSLQQHLQLHFQGTAAIPSQSHPAMLRHHHPQQHLQQLQQQQEQEEQQQQQPHLFEMNFQCMGQQQYLVDNNPSVQQLYQSHHQQQTLLPIKIEQEDTFAVYNIPPTSFHYHNQHQPQQPAPQQQQRQSQPHAYRSQPASPYFVPTTTACLPMQLSSQNHDYRSQQLQQQQQQQSSSPLSMAALKVEDFEVFRTFNQTNDANADDPTATTSSVTGNTITNSPGAITNFASFNLAQEPNSIANLTNNSRNSSRVNNGMGIAIISSGIVVPCISADLPSSSSSPSCMSEAQSTTATSTTGAGAGASEPQVLSLTMATNNLVLTTPSSSPNIASSPHPSLANNLGHQLSILTNSNNNNSDTGSAFPSSSSSTVVAAGTMSCLESPALTLQEEGNALTPPFFSKGKRRARSGCGNEGLCDLMAHGENGGGCLPNSNSVASKVNGPAVHHKKIANRRSRERLNKTQVINTNGSGGDVTIPPLPTPPQGASDVLTSPRSLTGSPSFSPLSSTILLSNAAAAPLYFTPPPMQPPLPPVLSMAGNKITTIDATSTGSCAGHGRSISTMKGTDPDLLLLQGQRYQHGLTGLCSDPTQLSKDSDSVTSQDEDLLQSSDLISFEFTTTLSTSTAVNLITAQARDGNNCPSPCGSTDNDGDSSVSEGDDLPLSIAAESKDMPFLYINTSSVLIGPASVSNPPSSKPDSPIRETSSSSPSSSTSPRAPAIHTCPICPKKFTRPFNLRSHLLAHGNVKPYECTAKVGVCGSRFTRRHDLMRHIKSKHLDYEWPVRARDNANNHGSERNNKTPGTGRKNKDRKGSKIKASKGLKSSSLVAVGPAIAVSSIPQQHEQQSGFMTKMEDSGHWSQQ
ncbi:hypothetical protein BGZ83_006957 [Gryganskiella cystojenkinii]|nr:hypothetical protein BGZ83_006957 [Gryganskiella cystojenkinii]